MDFKKLARVWIQWRYEKFEIHEIRTKIYFSLKIEAVCLSETLVSTYKSTGRFYPEDQYRHWNLSLSFQLRHPYSIRTAALSNVIIFVEHNRPPPIAVYKQNVLKAKWLRKMRALINSKTCECFLGSSIRHVTTMPRAGSTSSHPELLRN